MDPIPFVPVRYQHTLTDQAQALFSSNGVYRIEVDVADQLFDWTRADEINYTYLAKDGVSPATFRFYTDEYGTTAPLVITGIGMRPRGGYSFDQHSVNPNMKFKYKIAFPETDRFYGLNRINLNSNWGDSTLMREKLVYDLMNEAGVPSGRTTYARLYMNGNFMGLYLIVEQVGGQFFKARFDSVGNAYKNNWSELDWASLNRIDYIQSVSNTSPGLEISTNSETFDPADIIHFIDVLNNTPDALFKEEIERHLCVHQFLSVLSINSLVGLIDDYWYYAHNFFLYNYYDRFMWVPWDNDSSFGAQWAGFTVEISDPFAFGPRNTQYSAGKRPLIDRVLQVPEYFDYFKKCLKYHIEKYFNEAYLFPKIDSIKALIRNAVLEDPHQTGQVPPVFITDTDFTYAIETENQTWVHAIKPFITARSAYVLSLVNDAY
jgi:hypothetical protein